MTFGIALHQASVLMVGASQGIGLEFVRQLLARNEIQQVFATYRTPDTAAGLFALKENPRLTCLQADVTEEEDIASIAAAIQAHTTSLELMVNCVGVLHKEGVQPEKSLRQIETERLVEYFRVNSIPSVLLAKHLQPLLKKSDRSVFATISAKIGSIEDNRLGGWYGYRASKAALNMFLKNVAIEYSRKNPQTTVVALHPGTTDTRLSQPFQRNVPPEKLFSVDRTVGQLLKIIYQLTEQDNGSFFSWDGTRLPW